jgi:DNA-binding NarL/FixJ family response regulator
MEKIRVVLADDHPMIRASVRNMLHRTNDIVVVGEASNGYEAIEVARSLQPDVLILDMEMPGLKGLDVAEELLGSGFTKPILVLSAYKDKQMILGVLACGVSGYLTKDELPDTIIKAVRGVAEGEGGWVSRQIAEQLSIWNDDDAFITTKK